MNYYRPEIDGLRAIAVLAVVFYHAGFTLDGRDPFSGGFLGVDVFFVISGYLITSIILRRLERGSFSILEFYDRRMRRILPALFMVLAASLPLALWLMNTKALKEYAASGIAAIFFGSNYWFWQEDSYVAEPSALKPLLHTWSLAVEEQFYLVFPALLLVLWRLGGRVIIPAFLVLLAVSLAFAQHGSSASPDAAFYLLPYRGWELLAGAVLARLELAIGRSPSPRLSRYLPWLGLAVLVGAFVFWDHGIPHPGLLTVIPVAATMLMIWFCRGEDSATRLLASRPLVGIGLISYSFYLWHFPIFAFARIAHGEPDTGTKWLLISISLLLSVISFHLVERPARNRQRVRTRTVAVALLVVAVAMTGTFTQAFRLTSEKLSNYAFDGRAFNIEAEKAKRRKREAGVCQQKMGKVCGAQLKDRRVVLVVGDSTVPDAVTLLRPSFRNYRFVNSSLPGCPPHPALDRMVEPTHPNLAECLELNKLRFDPASLLNVDVVVISNFYTAYKPEDLRLYLDFLRQQDIDRVILIGNYIKLTEDFPFVLQKIDVGEMVSRDLGQLEPYVGAGMAPDEQLAQLASEYGHAFISLRDLACDDDDCLLFIDGYPFTWDRFHLSNEFARFLGERLAAEPRAW